MTLVEPLRGFVIERVSKPLNLGLSHLAYVFIVVGVVEEQELDTMTKKELTLEVERLKKLVFGDSSFVGSNDDEMVLLKLRDYTTHIMARVRVDADGFKHYYVMRGDGRCFRYGDFGVEWVKKLSI